MTWRTHALGGVASLWLLRPVIHEGDAASFGLLAGLAALGALLPDLDANEAKIRHLNLVPGVEPFALPAVLLSRLLGHRGLLHSLLGWGIVALALGLPLALFVGVLPAVALLLGYASHIILDGSTKHGVPLLYPRKSRWHALPAALRVTTGSAAEDAFFVPLALLCLGLLLSALTSG